MKTDGIEKAIRMALEAHLDQKDKGGQPYILHPLRIMNSVNHYEEKIVALLHDVVEDSDITLTDLQNEGFSEEVIFAVDCLTKRTEENYEDYLKRVAQSEIARSVKIADLTDNSDLSRIPSLTEKDYKRVQKYKQSIEFLTNYQSQI